MAEPARPTLTPGGSPVAGRPGADGAQRLPDIGGCGEAAIHETGGARMGDKPDNSVLNSYCQCWDADNVFVTDGRFVSSGFQNPTLTMMALTVRACRFIVGDYAKYVN
jgi:choline dehydrogenase-like flavoprotein